MMSDTFADIIMFSMLLAPRCEIPNRSGSPCRRSAVYTVNWDGHPVLACGHHVNSHMLYVDEDKLVKL